MFWNSINEQCSVSIQYDDGVLWRYICVRSCPDSECKLGIPPAILQELLGEEAYMRWEKFQLQVGLGVVLGALQNIFSKFVHCGNRTSCENFKLKICTCAQSHALGTHTKFQLEILTMNMISGIVYFRKLILESLQNISETTPSPNVGYTCGAWDNPALKLNGLKCMYKDVNAKVCNQCVGK